MKHLKKFENFSYNNSEETVDEGVLDTMKKVGKGISRGAERAGIYKSMTTRMDSIFGFNGEEFSPSSRLQIYINQGSDAGLATDDINLVESSLRKAREIGYGVSGWSDGVDLSKMDGSSEEKSIAKYLITRASRSIHSTANAEHEFGGKPRLSALESVGRNRRPNRKR